MIDEVVIRCSPAQLKIIQAAVEEARSDVDMWSHTLSDEDNKANRMTFDRLLALLKQAEQTQVFTH